MFDDDDDRECDNCGEPGTPSDPLIEWAEGIAHEFCGYERGWRQS